MAESGARWRASRPTTQRWRSALARVLAERGEFDVEAVREAYVAWLDTGPFDAGLTVTGALRGRMNPRSQANGALMRISPLAIFGATHEAVRGRGLGADRCGHHASQPGLPGGQRVVRDGDRARDSHGLRSGASSISESWTDAEAADVDSSLLGAVRGAAVAPPGDFLSQAGWVLIAFRNALWQLLHAVDLEEGVVDTVMRGGRHRYERGDLRGAARRRCGGSMRFPRSGRTRC